MTADAMLKVPHRTHELIRLGSAINRCSQGAFVDVAVAEFLANHREEIEAGLANASEVLASTTTAEPSPKCSHCNDSGVVASVDGDAMDCVYCPSSSRPVSTDEEEGQGLEDGRLQSRPRGGGS